jgi:hypothetical protein
LKSGITKYPPGKFSKKLFNEKCNKTQSRGPLAILSGKPWHPRDFNKNPTYPFPLIFNPYASMVSYLCSNILLCVTSEHSMRLRLQSSWHSRRQVEVGASSSSSSNGCCQSSNSEWSWRLAMKWSPTIWIKMCVRTWILLLHYCHSLNDA